MGIFSFRKINKKHKQKSKLPSDLTSTDDDNHSSICNNFMQESAITKITQSSLMSEIFSELSLVGLENHSSHKANDSTCNNKSIRHSLTLGSKQTQNSQQLATVNSPSNSTISTGSTNSIETDTTLISSRRSSIKSSSRSSSVAIDAFSITASSSTEESSSLHGSVKSELQFKNTDSRKNFVNELQGSSVKSILTQTSLPTSQDSPEITMSRMKDRHRQECRRSHYRISNHNELVDSNAYSSRWTNSLIIPQQLLLNHKYHNNSSALMLPYQDSTVQSNQSSCTLPISSTHILPTQSFYHPHASISMTSLTSNQLISTPMNLSQSRNMRYSQYQYPPSLYAPKELLSHNPILYRSILHIPTTLNILQANSTFAEDQNQKPISSISCNITQEVAKPDVIDALMNQQSSHNDDEKSLKSKPTHSKKKACKLTSSSCTHNSRDENQTCKIENLTSIDNTKCIKNTSKDYEISLMRKIHKEKCNSTPNDLHLLDNKVNALGNDDVLVDKLAKKDCREKSIKIQSNCCKCNEFSIIISCCHHHHCKNNKKSCKLHQHTHHYKKARHDFCKQKPLFERNHHSCCNMNQYRNCQKHCCIKKEVIDGA